MSQHHEESDVNVRALFGFAAGLFAVAVVVHLLILLMFSYFDRREAAASSNDFPIAVGHETRLPPQPRLQTTPREDLQQFRAREQEKLDGYQWVDKTAGVVRIPISEAMKLTLQRGLPARGPKAAGK